MLGLETFIENSEVRYKYLLQLALNQKVSWTAVKTFIRELTSDLETAMKLNNVLLEELQSLHSKILQNQQDETNKEIEVEQPDTLENGSENYFILPSKQERFGDELSYEENNATEKESEILDRFVIETTSLENEIVEESHLESNGNEQESNDFTLDKYQTAYNDIDLHTVITNTGIDDGEDVSGVQEFETNGSDENKYNSEEITLSEDERNSVNRMDKTVEKQLDIPNSCFKTSKETEKNESSSQNRKVLINGRKRYSCETCGQLFSLNGNLKIHKRIHSGEKPFECKYCSKKFNQSQALKKHETIHTREKPFKCRYCKNTFSNIISLMTHEKDHNGECKYCGKVFIKSMALKHHERMTSLEKPIECNFCNNILLNLVNSKGMKKLTMGEEKNNFIAQIVPKNSTGGVTSLFII